MNAFFDERCLLSSDLNELLAVWRRVGRFVQTNGSSIVLYLDGWAVRSPEFLVRFNRLRDELRTLHKPFLFGAEYYSDWRLAQRAGDTLCRLETEAEHLTNCGVCEAYEHRLSQPAVMIFGGSQSSFGGRDRVAIERITPANHPQLVACGIDFVGFTRVGAEWNCILIEYDVNLTRPPRDDETALGHYPNRFTKVGRFERHGRRQVYRELATGRLFYVDNLHFGQAAHLEVFDQNEQHLGIAHLSGQVDESEQIEGREIKW